METFLKDERADKVNLSIGLYYDEAGKIPTLPSVKEAKAVVNNAEEQPCIYLPMEGLAPYRELVQALVFGDDHPARKENRIVTIQTLGGSGALMIGSDFLHHYFPESQAWLSKPTWENHQAILNGAGIKTHDYPYFDVDTRGLDFDAMLNKIDSLPAQSIVLLHACCHNPTGVDLDTEQWDKVIAVIKQRGLIAFFDMAYQGFGDSLAEDAYAIRQMAKDPALSFFVANSFSKIFSLYGERVGGLSVVCQNEEAATRVLGQLKATVRRNYSSPAKYGAVLVNQVLGNSTFNQQWQDEVSNMRERITLMRYALYAKLELLRPDGDYNFLIEQKGMFSYTGFTSAQVDTLRDEHGIYLIASGRMCLAGLNENNIDHVAKAFAAL
jgi:aromatic-amino-acid transaminase